MNLPEYDLTSQESILQHARELEDSSIEDTLRRYSIYLNEYSDTQILFSVSEDELFKGKGRFGQYLEKQYFGLQTNNESRPDFEEVGLELKVAPLKRLKSTGELRAKERVVLGIIDYHKIINDTFEKSHFAFKNAEILLVFYIHDQLKQLKDLHVELVDIWRCLQEDFDQIQEDWNVISSKIHNGEAEKLSEGETLLLGACTKGSTMLRSMVSQPNSNKLARKRAFCFKMNYVNYIFTTLMERKHQGRRTCFETRLIPAGSHLSLEKTIEQVLFPFIGLSGPEIAEKLGCSYNVKDKARYARLSYKILGFSRVNQSIHEFNAAGIRIKTVRVLKNGNPAESMSFKAIDFCEIVEEEWEDSDFYQSVISKFVILVFNENSVGEFNLKGLKFWNMPLEDYPLAEKVWEDTKSKIIGGDYNNFIKQEKPPGERGVAHVRPHGVKGQKVLTPQETYEPPKSFWFDKGYVKEIITDLL